MRSIDDEVLVEYGVFGLMDLDVDECPRPWPEGSMEPGVAVEAIRNRVDITSAARDHLAAVRLESWPSMPVTDREVDDEVTVELTSGTVQLWSVTGGPGREFKVGPTGTYHLRVSCEGHEAAMQQELVPDYTERYLLQFWPA